MSESELANKRLRMEAAEVCCILCDVQENPEVMSTPKNESSWNTLYNAAVARKFEPILKFPTPPELSKIYYHRNCHSKFTHKKTLTAIASSHNSSPDVCSLLDDSDRNEGQETSFKKERLHRKRNESNSTVYEEICIFCNKVSKHQKGQKTREPLRQAEQLRVDHTLRKIAIEKSDAKILQLTSRDVVAAEARYHHSCYKVYTRVKPKKMKADVGVYIEKEKNARKYLFNYIRNELFCSPIVVSLIFLQEKLISFMRSEGEKKLLILPKKILNFIYKRNLESHYLSLQYKIGFT